MSIETRTRSSSTTFAASDISDSKQVSPRNSKTESTLTNNSNINYTPPISPPQEPNSKEDLSIELSFISLNISDLSRSSEFSFVDIIESPEFQKHSDLTLVDGFKTQSDDRSSDVLKYIKNTLASPRMVVGQGNLLEAAKSKLSELETLWRHQGVNKSDADISDGEYGANHRDILLQPVVDALDIIINDELRRREKVFQEIQRLKERLEYLCSRLDQSIELFLLNIPVSANEDVDGGLVFVSDLIQDLETTVQNRMEKINSVVDLILKLKVDLGDMNFEPYLDKSSEDLSEARLRSCLQCLKNIEIEKRIRYYSLSQLIVYMRTLYHQLGGFPESTKYENVLLSIFPKLDPISEISNLHNRNITFIAGKIGLSTDTATAPLHFSPLRNRFKTKSDDGGSITASEASLEKEFLYPDRPFSPTKRLTSETELSFEIEYLLREVFQKNDSASLLNLKPLSVDRQCLTELYQLFSKMHAERTERVESVEKLVREIVMFWDQLETPLSERYELKMDLGKYREYKDLRDKLQILWSDHMADTVNKLLDELTALWDLCDVDELERQRTLSQISTDDFYSPMTVEYFKEEISKLRTLNERRQFVLEMVEERKQFIQKIIEFEQSASDPKRLFKSSFQLNEEERFRKTCFPTLLKMEDVLKLTIVEYENETGRYLTSNGVRVLDAINQEIHDRFISEGIYHISSESGAQNTSMTNEDESHQSGVPHENKRSSSVSTYKGRSGSMTRQTNMLSVAVDSSEFPVNRVTKRPPSVTRGRPASIVEPPQNLTPSSANESKDKEEITMIFRGRTTTKPSISSKIDSPSEAPEVKQPKPSRPTSNTRLPVRLRSFETSRDKEVPSSNAEAPTTRRPPSLTRPVSSRPFSTNSQTENSAHPDLSLRRKKRPSFELLKNFNATSSQKDSTNKEQNVHPRPSSIPKSPTSTLPKSPTSLPKSPTLDLRASDLTLKRPRSSLGLTSLFSPKKKESNEILDRSEEDTGKVGLRKFFGRSNSLTRK
ncbi:hypothetical protein HK098_000243 [Nowakowskiella sp. JEL0407]|nr:hypothetical protein HK098_000237 [Nowakowskiella sp. JEL0407]KAJ3125490.1 hypothetical protein HK098_000243 [Nowakowskiella sp. JEL0407]